MNIPEAILLFSVSAGSVFTQAFQSRNVNQGHMLAAGMTSLAIGMAQTISLKLVPQANGLASMLYILGGPVGVTAAIYVHGKTLGRRKRLSDLREQRKKRKINYINISKEGGTKP